MFNSIAIFLLSAAVAVLSGCRTQQSFVKKLHSFYIEKKSGTVKLPVTDTDAVINDTLLIVYIEATTNDLKWDSAVFKGKQYRVIPQLITTGIFEAGFNEKGEPVVMKVAEGYYLYQLQFEAKGLQNFRSADDAIIHYRYKKQHYKVVLQPPVLLQQLPPV
jgi:hypothetical protein